MVQDILGNVLGYMNPVAWVTLVIVLICVIRGLADGLVISVYRTFGFILAIGIAISLTPVVSNALADTPVYELTYKQVQKALFSENFTPSTQAEGNSAAEAGANDTGADNNAQTDISAENVLIGALPLPAFIKEALINNNNPAMYDALGITEFRSYVAAYITKMLLHAIIFILLMIIISLLLHMIAKALDLVARLPVLHTLNKLGGLIFGFVNAVIALWLLCTFFTIISGTDLGKEIYRQINELEILKIIYDQNGLMRIIADVQRLLK